MKNIEENLSRKEKICSQNLFPTHPSTRTRWFEETGRRSVQDVKEIITQHATCVMSRVNMGQGGGEGGGIKCSLSSIP